MKKFSIIFVFTFMFLTCFSTSASADAVYSWAGGIGGSGSSANTYSVAVDTDGNVYTTGNFQGTVDFDPSAGTGNLTSNGSNDIYISKFDSTGAFVWVKQIGGSNNDSGNSIAVDSSGNVYITGKYAGTVDFDPGAGTSNLASSSSSNDIFVAKYSSSGTLTWAKSMGGASSDEGSSIYVDSSGNVYTTGYFNGGIDADPGAGTVVLTSAGVEDVFISKLDSTGTYVWAKKVGGTGSDIGYGGIYVDASSNVYVAGQFSGTSDFDPGAGTSNLVSAGSTDVFVLKLDSSGTYSWSGKMGGTGADNVYDIFVDSSSNVYTVGNFAGTVDFDPGAGTSNLVSAGSSDVFISKLNSSGVYVWANKFGGTSADIGKSIRVDSSGNVYTTGYFSGTADFDPGAGTSNLTSAGSEDIFISELDSSGSFVFVKQFGGTDSEMSYGIYLDSNAVYTVGTFLSSTVDFDPGAGTANLSLIGASYNGFVSKLTSVSAPTVTTGSSSSITATTVTLGGNITATGGVDPTTRGVYYGTTVGYGSTASESGSYSTGAYTINVTGLTCNTTYHYQAFTTNTSGTGTGSDDTFTTSSCVVEPTVVTDPASNLDTTTATLNGTISATGGADNTTRGFNYGLTDSYGSTASATGTYSTGAYTEAITGLTCNTTYHFRFFATNSAGTTNGSDDIFTTSACPIARIYGSTKSIYNPYNQVGQNTIKNVDEVVIFSETLRVGKKSIDNVLMQKFLNKNGEFLVVDGIFGKKTKAALMRFQEKHNLQIDGIFGPKTITIANSLNKI